MLECDEARIDLIFLLTQHFLRYLTQIALNIMPILQLAAFLSLLAVSTLAFAQLSPRALQEEDKYFRPLLVVAPTFPTRDPSDVLPVEIRVSGSVNAEGALETPEFSPTVGNEKFINAIKDVLNLWRFRPAIDEKSCAPTISDGVLLVWFEEKNGVPSVSVSTPKRQPVSETADAKPRPLPRVFLNRPKPEYPSDARRAGMEGSAELLLNVNHQGDVLQTTVLSSIPHKMFGDSAYAGARRVKFSAGAPEDDAQKPACILVPFKYSLTSGARYPSSACGK